MNTTIIHAHELAQIQAAGHAYAAMAITGAAMFAALVLFGALWWQKKNKL